MSMNMITLNYLVTRALRRHAARVAIVDGARQVTYAELDWRSNALAAALLKIGCKTGDRVALLLHKGIEVIEAEIAIIRAGLVKVPINTTLSRLLKSPRSCKIAERGC